MFEEDETRRTTLGDGGPVWGWSPVGAVLLSVALGVLWQGSRGIWDPSEGFYANVAVEMFRTGDYWLPRLNGEAFLDKPPFLYWSLVAGLRWLGFSDWGLRLPLVVWFAATAWVVGAFAERMWGPGHKARATIVYCVMLLPFVAANVATTDTVLAFWTTFVMFCFWRMCRADDRGELVGWTLGVGVAAGFGLLTKGPALLVFLPPLGAYLMLRRELTRTLRRPEVWAAVLLAVMVGGSWYGSIAASVEGATDYFLHNQVTGRLLNDDYGRNPGLAGAFAVYLPVALAGGLPWSPLWVTWVVRARKRWTHVAWWKALRDRPQALLLALWCVLPALVLIAASSKLPLYVLPLCAPAALITARGMGVVLVTPRTTVRTRRRWLLAWVLVLLSVKLGASYWPTHQDGKRIAAALRRAGVPTSAHVVAVDTFRNSLEIYGFESIGVLATKELDPFFTPIDPLKVELKGLPVSRTRVAFVGMSPALHLVRKGLGAKAAGCLKHPVVEKYEVLDCRLLSVGRPAVR